jgi:hypothetical protein
VLLGEIRKGFVGTVKGDYCQGKLLDNSSFESDTCSIQGY